MARTGGINGGDLNLSQPQAGKQSSAANGNPSEMKRKKKHIKNKT
jgi:hypothetical protein